MTSTVFVLLAMLLAAPVVAQNRMFPDGIAGYSGVGRIKWNIPEGPDFGCGFAVPHFTQGARVLCGYRSEPSARTEISVYSRDLMISAGERREKYLEEMRRHLPDALEATVELRDYGGGDSPIVYTSFTRRERGHDNSRAVVGYRVKGPFLIRFLHETRDASSDLEPMLRVVLSAEPLDALPMLAWKLDDYKAICSERFPGLRRLNDAALARSMFGKVDWQRYFREQEPKRDEAELAARLKSAQLDLADQLTKAGQLEAFCSAFWFMTFEAERGLPGARRRTSIAAYLGQATPTGALVEQVFPDGPAARAGLRVGDVILKFGDESVENSSDVVRSLLAIPGETRVAVQILRDGKKSEITVTTAATTDD